MRQRPHQRIRPVRAPAPRRLAPQRHHLLLQRRKRAAVDHSPLLVERRHRLGPRLLRAAGVHQPDLRLAVRLPQQGPHHLPALVGLGQHQVGAELRRRLGHAPRPSGGRQAPRRTVGQHVAGLVPAPRDHDAAGVAVGAGRRVHRHHHPLELRRPVPPRPRQVLGPKQGAVGLDDQPLHLLRLQPRPGVERSQMAQEAGRQIGRIARRRQLRPVHARLGQQLPQRRDRTRRRGNGQLGVGPQPQPEPQVRQRRLDVPPGAELVGPGRMELRPPQAVGVLRRKGVGRRAARPDQAPPPRLPARPVVARRLGLQPRRPLDHHLAHVVQGRPDQGEGQVFRLGQLVHPEPAGEGLARPAPAQQHPGAPVGVRRPDLVLGQPRRRPQQPQQLLARRLRQASPGQIPCVRRPREDDRDETRALLAPPVLRRR
ncbi:hypothetical protein D3C73_851410 [compost metagenome]